MRFFAGALLAASLVLATGGASAQGTDAAAAQTLFEQGQQAKKNGDYSTARAKFAESERLDRAAGTLLNLADCEEQVNALADAWQHWHEAVDLIPAGDARVAVAKKRLSALDPRVPRLMLTLAAAPAGAVVQRDGVELGAASLGVALPVNPGSHTIVVKAPGAAGSVQTVTIGEGETRALALAVGPPQPDAAPAARSSGATRRILGIVLGGVGVAGFGAAAATGLLLPAKRDAVAANCHGKVCNQAGLDAASAGQKLLAANTAAWVVGYAGVGAGLTLVLTSWIGDEQGAAVSASAGPDGGRFSLTGSF